MISRHSPRMRRARKVCGHIYTRRAFDCYLQLVSWTIVRFNSEVRESTFVELAYSDPFEWENYKEQNWEERCANRFRTSTKIRRTIGALYAITQSNRLTQFTLSYLNPHCKRLPKCRTNNSYFHQDVPSRLIIPWYEQNKPEQVRNASHSITKVYAQGYLNAVAVTLRWNSAVVVTLMCRQTSLRLYSDKFDEFCTPGNFWFVPVSSKEYSLAPFFFPL